MIEACLVLLSLLFSKHLVCDWFLQCSFPYQYTNKGTYGHKGGLLHSGLAIVGSAVVFGWMAHSSYGNFFTKWNLFTLNLWLLLFLEFTFHYHIDWLKVNINTLFKLDMTRHASFWNLVGVDQFAHYMSYIFIAYMVFGV